MKKLGYILIVLALLAAVPFFFAEQIIGRVVVSEIEKATGLRASFEKIHVGILKPVVRLNGITISNPPEFADPEFINAREIYIRYSLLSLFSQNIRLNEVRIDLSNVVLIRPEKGDVNVKVAADTIKERAHANEAPAAPAKPKTPSTQTGSTKETVPPREENSPPAMTIDKLHVKLDKMEVRSYGKDGGEPAIMPVQLGLNRSYDDVTNFDDVVTDLSGELIARSSASLINNLGTMIKSVIDEDGNIDLREAEKQLKDLKKLFR